MAKARAFTLVELLTVISIIAILSAILMPAAMSVRAMAYQYSATQALGQIGSASSMYASDNDETFMPAFYPTGQGYQLWFGFKSFNGAVDTSTAMLRPYLGKKILTDPIYKAKAYLGDMSGFGYNWAYIGSDFGVTNNYSTFPYCQNPAQVPNLSNPSKTVLMATSSFYFAPWLPHGDSQTYDFGFIDPPAFWFGDPDIDFRHLGARSPDTEMKIVTSTGHAPVAYTDGHTGILRQTQVRNENFVR